MHVSNDMGIKRRNQTPDIPRLLLRKLSALTVGIDVGAEFSLEIADSVRVVTRQDKNVQLLEQAGSPSLIGVHLAEQGQDALISSGLVAVDGALKVHADLGRVTGSVGCEVVGARRLGQKDIGNATALL